MIWGEKREIWISKRSRSPCVSIWGNKEKENHKEMFEVDRILAA